MSSNAVARLGGFAFVGCFGGGFGGRGIIHDESGAGVAAVST